MTVPAARPPARRPGRRPLPTFVLVVVAALVVVALVPATAEARTNVSPVVGRSASAVTATALPTAQIDGIVWAQVMRGDTVYAGGSFTTARPAGVAVGGAGQVTRNNLMSYDVTTGVMTSFAPDVEGTVQALALSPDGSRLYVGGSFTTVNGQNRYRIAAFDTATGSLVSTFAPGLDYIVYSIVVTSSTVYVGGAFTNAGGNSRPYLAAYALNGALLSWNPVADGPVRALALTGDGKRLVVGGSFTTLAGVTAQGLGSVDPVTGASQDFPANKVVYAYGPRASFFSLAVLGDTVYGSAYKYMGTGNLEGAFAASATTGALTWVEDCHGDTYSVFPTADQLYTVGHPHFCRNIGGYPQQNPPQRALAFTTVATGTVQHNTQGTYPDLYGNPSPSLTVWFPTLEPGQVSGSLQAAWSVTGDDRYVVMGGEFPVVNGVAQQGLVRFAVPSVGADEVGPTLAGSSFKVKSTKAGSGAVTLTVKSNYDADDLTLAYQIQRDTGEGTTATTIWQGDGDATYWQRPTITVGDSGLTPRATYRYRAVATDPAGHQAVGDWLTVKAPA